MRRRRAMSSSFCLVAMGAGYPLRVGAGPISRSVPLRRHGEGDADEPEPREQRKGPSAPEDVGEEDKHDAGPRAGEKRVGHVPRGAPPARLRLDGRGRPPTASALALRLRYGHPILALSGTTPMI